MSTATTIGQLTGRTPTEDQIVFEAMHTASVTKPGKMMYLGRKSDDGVSIPDARLLLKNRGISTVFTRYAADEGGKALEDLMIAVAEPNASAMVGVHGATILDADEIREVVVVDLGATSDKVCLHDSCAAAAVEVSLSDFMVAWKVGGFELVVAELTEQPARQSATWLRIRPRRESVDPDLSTHLRRFRNRSDNGREIRSSTPDGRS